MRPATRARAACVNARTFSPRSTRTCSRTRVRATGKILLTVPERREIDAHGGQPAEQIGPQPMWRGHRRSTAGDALAIRRTSVGHRPRRRGDASPSRARCARVAPGSAPAKLRPGRPAGNSVPPRAQRRCGNRVHRPARDRSGPARIERSRRHWRHGPEQRFRGRPTSASALSHSTTTHGAAAGDGRRP